SLFDWLDRLQSALMAHLQPRDTAWKPFNPACPFFLLPVGWPPGFTRLDPAYFSLPLCEGSDPLPWCAQAPPRPPFEFTHDNAPPSRAPESARPGNPRHPCRSRQASSARRRVASSDGGGGASSPPPGRGRKISPTAIANNLGSVAKVLW